MKKNKKILIIGNGFDLAHELPTCYYDFLKFCEKILLVKGNHSDSDINNFSSQFEEDFNIHIKQQIMEIYSTSNSIKTSVKYNYEYVNEIYSCIHKNSWYLYFLDIWNNHTIKGIDWIDFESEMSEIINLIDSTYVELNSEFGRVNGNNLTILREFDYVSIPIKLYNFLKYVKTNWQRKYAKVSDLREVLYDDLNKLIRALEIYLDDFVGRINITKKSPDIQTINPDYIINFNYTNTYEKVYGNNKKCDIFYVHGNCDASRNIKENNMVLGIDDYDNKKINFTIFKKFAQRILKGNGIKDQQYLEEIEKNYKDIKGVIHGNDDPKKTFPDNIAEIYVYGHSLDKTDKDILKEFFCSPATAVKIYCHNEGSKGNLLSNMIDLIGKEVLLEKIYQEPSKLEFIIQKEMVKMDEF